MNCVEKQVSPVINLLSMKTATASEMQRLKELFRETINSERLMSYMTNVQHLLMVLDRLDILNDYDIETFKSINSILNDSDIGGLLDEGFVDVDPPPLRNEFELQRLQEELQESSIQKKETVSNSCSVSKDQEKGIHKLIAKEIGRKWREFGRHMDIGEGELEQVDLECRGQFVDKIYKIFSLLEETENDVGRRIETICSSLENCRRKDLAKKIRNIIGQPHVFPVSNNKIKE